MGFKQIPLRGGDATTIHKSQGQSLDMAIIDVGPKIFEPGQGYVALSRLKSIDGLSIQSISRNAFQADPEVIKFYSKLN